MPHIFVLLAICTDIAHHEWCIHADHYGMANLRYAHMGFAV